MLVFLIATGLFLSFWVMFYVKWVNKGTIGLHRHSGSIRVNRHVKVEIPTVGDVLSLIPERQDLTGGFREIQTSEGIVNNEGWKTY